MPHDTPESWRKLSPSDGHYGFGYYDRNPWNADASLHLAIKMPQSERIPQRGERAQVGVIERETGRFHSLAQTRAWNHQQGAMTQWLPGGGDRFVFNDFDELSGRLITRCVDVKGRSVRTFDRPIYVLSPDGRWGASLSFARIPRRGYSYADAGFDETPPDADGDGIFLTDMRSGESRLCVSYRQIFDAHPARFLAEGCHSWLNHILFNRDATKLLFLLRHTAEVDRPYPWQTHLFTAATDGSDLACVMPDVYWKWVSHHIWGRTPGEILIDANWRGKGNEYVVFDERTRPMRATRVSPGLGPCGHLIFSPDGKRILADTYEMDGWQTLALVRTDTGELEVIGRFAHPGPEALVHDVRCDLHPKWNHDGTLISVDTLHDGMRGIYIRSCPDGP